MHSGEGQRCCSRNDRPLEAANQPANSSRQRPKFRARDVVYVAETTSDIRPRAVSTQAQQNAL